MVLESKPQDDLSKNDQQINKAKSNQSKSNKKYIESRDLKLFIKLLRGIYN